MVRVIVIGIDGGTFKVINRYTSELPNITALMRGGVSGSLKSPLPITFPAWKCYSTGKSPGKLGVYDFSYVDKFKFKYYTSRHFRQPEIWDYLGERRYSSVVVNMPTTYPPKKIKGCIVSGHVVPFEKNYTYPKQIEKIIKDKFDYRVNLRTSLIYDPRTAVQEILTLIRKRFSVFKFLIDKFSPDFGHLTIFYTDAVQHFFWDCMETNAENNPVLETWKVIDEEIGKLIASLDEPNIILMSDHGFDRVKGSFSLNTWLYKKGYLKLKKTPKRSFISYLINEASAYYLIKKFGILGFKEYIPKFLKEKITKFLTSAEKGFRICSEDIDWKKTKAVGLTGFCIYLNKKDRRLKAKIINELKTLKDPKFSENPFSDIYDIEEIWGDNRQSSPDIVVIGKNWRVTGGNILPSPWDYSRKPWQACHTQNGIFIANGPVFKRNIKVNATIYDIAPTILYIFGVRIPSELDGKILKDALVKPSIG